MPHSQTTDRHFAGKVAVVTGAAAGIGRALAAELVGAGARVILADLQPARLDAAVADLRGRGGDVRGETTDVADFGAVDRLVAGVFEREGRLDFMFNNAGIAIGGGAHHFEIGDWRRVLDVNLGGVVNGVQAVYRRMIAQGSGHIVNTASTAGLVPSGRSVAYSASKHAIVGLSTSLREQARMHGVKVTVLCPGVVRTELLTGGAAGSRELVPLTEAETTALLRALQPITPEKFARHALRAVRKNQAIYVQGALMRVVWWIYRLAPTWGIRLDHALLQASPLARTLR
jgi:NAD(P)-dependent dehydrogenase (short-subunit alcohol dehydrogenase family)